jgi:hypothetical protein
VALVAALAASSAAAAACSASPAVDAPAPFESASEVKPLGIPI